MAKAEPSRIRRLLDDQGAAIAALDDKQVAAFLQAYEDARRELREQLERMARTGRDQATPFTAQQLRVMLAQVEAGVAALQQRLQVALSAAMQEQRRRSMDNLLAVIEAGEVEFPNVGPQIETRALERLSQDAGLLLHEHSVRRYGQDLVDAIQRQLVVGHARGQGFRDLIDRVVATDDSVFASRRHRAELIVRMETNRAYNDMHLHGLQAAKEVLDKPKDGHGPRPDPLLQRIDEFLDKRNHPFSRAADGLTAEVSLDRDQPALFRVPVAAVEAFARAMKKRVSGIVWKKEGAFYVGTNLPAHFNERGRITAWRSSWGTPGDPPAPPLAPEAARDVAAGSLKAAGVPAQHLQHVDQEALGRLPPHHQVKLGEVFKDARAERMSPTEAGKVVNGLLADPDREEMLQHLTSGWFRSADGRGTVLSRLKKGADPGLIHELREAGRRLAEVPGGSLRFPATHQGAHGDIDFYVLAPGGDKPVLGVQVASIRKPRGWYDTYDEKVAQLSRLPKGAADKLEIVFFGTGPKWKGPPGERSRAKMAATMREAKVSARATLVLPDGSRHVLVEP